VKGRAFTDSDGAPGQESAVVTQRFVARFLQGHEPIGRRIRVRNPNARDTPALEATIVGVSPTVRQQFMSELDAVVYLPYRAINTGPQMLLVRSRSDAGSVVSLIRDEVRALDAGVPVFGIMPLDTFMRQSRWGHSVFGTMFAVFAGIALTLAGVGLYGVTAHSVARRTPEIGLRVALGAEPSQVVSLFVGRVVPPLAVGLALGVAGALWVGRLLRGFLVQTSPTDPVTLVCMTLLLSAVALVACILPARRAARLDPVRALRCE
jgi:putative ABC transport system permease protein